MGAVADHLDLVAGDHLELDLPAIDLSHLGFRGHALTDYTAIPALDATLNAGASVGEMAYLAPSPDLGVHSVDILVSQPATTVSFTPEAMDQLSLATRHLFDKAFIGVLVRRLHAAHETLAHPRRIL